MQIGIIAVVCVIIAFIVFYRPEKKVVEKKEIKAKKKPSEPFIIPGNNYINPTDFSIGVIKRDKYQSADQCHPNVLYPINGLGVDYGSVRPNNMPCAQFLQSP